MCVHMVACVWTIGEDTSTVMCIDMCIGTSVDMCTGMCIDTCTGMCIDMYMTSMSKLTAVVHTVHSACV